MHRYAPHLALALLCLAACSPRDPATITTAKGAVTVPGGAFADGRDPDASTPTTVTAINVWESAARTRRACQVPHGAALELVSWDRNEAEGRYYFEIRAYGCTGWLPEAFVSADRS